MENNLQDNQKMKFSKTDTEYNMKSIRFLLLTITTMFIVIAALMIVMGISVYSHYHSFSFFYEGARGGRFFTPSVFSVLLGLVILVVTSFGFFGSMKQSTCMVNLYAFILTLILIVKLVVVVLAFTTHGDVIVNYIDIPVAQYADDPEIEMEIDQIQTSLNCCGSSSFMDYLGVPFTSNHSTVLVPREIDGDVVGLMVPQSCCTSSADYICLKMRSNGCKQSLVNLIVQNASVLGVLGVSVMFIQLLGIIFALLLARCIRKLKSERALTSWKIKEQMILAREAHAKEQQQTNEGQTDVNSVYIVHPESSIA